jgi:hypothetical protein
MSSQLAPAEADIPNDLLQQYQDFQRRAIIAVRRVYFEADETTHTLGVPPVTGSTPPRLHGEMEEVVRASRHLLLLLRSLSTGNVKGPATSIIGTVPEPASETVSADQAFLGGCTSLAGQFYRPDLGWRGANFNMLVGLQILIWWCLHSKDRSCRCGTGRRGL